MRSGRDSRAGDVDVVVASRYSGGGTAQGLADRSRVLVSKTATALTRAMFPIRLREVTDPMTGFFLIDRRVVDEAIVKPRGFKILLEILARQNLRVAEVPFDFAEPPRGRVQGVDAPGRALRHAAHGAPLRQDVAVRRHRRHRRARRTSRSCGGSSTSASTTSSPRSSRPRSTIIGNFLLQERFVFQDMRGAASGGWLRFAKSFSFNNAEALIRIPILALLVESWHISAVVRRRHHPRRRVRRALRVPLARRLRAAQGRRRRRAAPASFVEELDAQAMSPGEL